MNISSTNQTRARTSILAKIQHGVTLTTSLLIFVVLQFLGSQTGINLLSTAARQKRRLMSILAMSIVVFIGLWFSLSARPFSTEFLGIQILGITAVSSVLVVGYRTMPEANLVQSLHRVKWLLILAVLQISQWTLNAIQFLTNAANKKLVLKGLAVVTLLITAVWFRQPILELTAVLSDQQAVVSYLEQFGPLAPVLLSIALVAQVFIAAIPGHILMLGGGYVYGFWTIFLISLVTTVGASQLAFLLAKKAGHPLVERLAPRQILEKWDGAAAANGMVFFMFAFMLPIFPADVLNYVAGLSPISGRRFFVANLFGRLPGLVLLSVLGANGLALTPQLTLTVTAVGLLMFAGWYYLFVYSKRKI